MNGADFVCIGQVKAGTQWLYDQARSHPDCWMTPIKELHYFNHARHRQFPPMSFARAAHKALLWQSDPRVRAFYLALLACEGYGIEAELYAGLFAAKGSKKSGDISPGYCALDPKTIEAFARCCPQTKFLYIAREPVSRAWSDISMMWRHGKFDEKLLWCEASLRGYLSEKRMQDLSYNSRTLQRWASVFSPDRLRVFFFDVTDADADGQRSAIFDFIGLDASKKGAFEPDYNVKKGRAKLTLTPEIARWLERFYVREREAFNRMILSDFKTYCLPACPQ